MNSPDRYYVERTLGRGGMATVYLARDQALDRPVALKVLADHFAADPAYRERFLREARLAAKLVHPNVVQVYDVGEDERGPFIVMEYVAGETLGEELKRRGRLPAAEVVAVGIQICSALEAAHAERLVHRDIKPQNILRGPDGHVKLADFGIARSLEGTRQTEIGTVLGTAAYLSPEQARGDPVTASADIYSLGVVLYELATGQTPFDADTLSELIVKRDQGTLTPPREVAPEVPAALEATIMSCLASSPEDRPASAAVLARELAASIDEPVTEPLPEATGVLATDVVLATAPTVALRAGRPGRSRRGRIVAALAAVALVALGAILAVTLTDSGSPNAATTTTKPHTTKPTTTSSSSTSTASTTTTKPTTTTPVTTSTTTTTPPPAQTPVQEISYVRTAIGGALAAGLVDPKVGQDLFKRLDDVSSSIGRNNLDEAAHRAADMLHHVEDLARNAKNITAAAVARISAPLTRLETLLAPASNTPPAPAPGHGNSKKPPKPKHRRPHRP